MTELPKRTGATDLTDDELLLFDFFWQWFVPRHSLDSESYSLHMNVAYTHGLNSAQIDDVLKNLLERELITCRKTSHQIYTLTPRGGALWESERQPVWERYISEPGSHNDKRLSVVTLNEALGRCYIGAMFSAGLIVPTTRIKCRPLKQCRFAPWKPVAGPYLLRVNIRRDEQIGLVDWTFTSPVATGGEMLLNWAL